jgi:phenylpropionate dioxygenase-like ring-hydroxylating dioxygenase large terminal subunit
MQDSERNYRYPAEHYTSRRVIELENEKLWPKVWLIAARTEEVRNPGDFVTFDIAGESILIVRTTQGEVKAYYNVCQHRGRRLKDGSGNTGDSIHCAFHGWRYSINDGSLIKVVYEEEWQTDPGYCRSDIKLPQLRIDFWAGWIWVSMDPDIQPLAQYLAPVPRFLDKFELQETRFAWYKTIVIPCNWKVVLDAFNEGYHVTATHSQLMRFGELPYGSKGFGRHAYFYNWEAPAAAAAVSGEPGTTKPTVIGLMDGNASFDLRKILAEAEHEREETLKALGSVHTVNAAQRLLTEVPKEAGPMEVLAAFRRFHREEAEAAGVKWPTSLSEDDIRTAGIDWHIFPNTIALPSIDGALWYRSRPNGDDPASCIFDIWWIQRFAPGKEPPLRRDFYSNPDQFKGQNFFLEQDVNNLIAVQRGARSRGYKSGRTNPRQELAVRNFHRVLDVYLYGDGPDEATLRPDHIIEPER